MMTHLLLETLSLLLTSLIAHEVFHRTQNSCKHDASNDDTRPAVFVPQVRSSWLTLYGNVTWEISLALCATA